MNNASPPRIATWLLKRLLSSPARESLIGDLIEQHHRGRSSVWYWRQVFLAVLHDAFREMRDHKLLAIRAIIVGMSVQWFIAGARVVIWFFISPALWYWTAENNLDTLQLLLFRPSGYVHIYVIRSLIVWLFVGWLVARTHRAQAIAMVLAFIVFRTIVQVGERAWLYGSGVHPPFDENLAFVCWLAISVVVVIVGAILGADRKGTTMPHSA